MSFVGGYSLMQALGDVESVIVMQSVPPLESNLPIVEVYLSSLRQFDDALEPNSVSLEGFTIPKIFHQGLLNIEGNITKESIIDGLELLHDIDIGLGVDIYVDENQHQAIHDVWMTHFKAGKIASFTWPMLQKKTIRE